MVFRSSLIALILLIVAGCSEQSVEAQQAIPQDTVTAEPSQPIVTAPTPQSNVTYASAVRCAALAKVFLALSPDDRAIRDGFNQFLISARAAALKRAPEYNKGAIDVDQEIQDLSVRIAREAMGSGNVSEYNQNLLKEAQQNCAEVS